MNYFDARPLADGSGFHFTCKNDGRIWGVGYDGAFQTCPSCKGRSFGWPADTEHYCQTCEGKGAIAQEPHPPHATKEEAYECATRFVLDNARWDGPSIDTRHSVPRCEMEACDTLVDDGGGATWGIDTTVHTVLCGEHRNRESLATIVGTVGQVWSS